VIRKNALIRTLCWLSFFSIILLSWWYLYSMSQMSGLNVFGQSVRMNMMKMDAFGTLFPMWSIMMAAMMLPTMVPTLRSYEDLMKSADGTRIGWFGVIIGFSIVWIAGAAIFALLQLILLKLGLINLLGVLNSLLIASIFLIIVGCFQFTWIKNTCHVVCHSPFTFFLKNWRLGFRGGFLMGSGLGLYCVGCCWGFMILGFVGGTMNLLWMGLATLLMVLEKLPQVGAYLAKPIGVTLILIGLSIGARAINII